MGKVNGFNKYYLKSPLPLVLFVDYSSEQRLCGDSPERVVLTDLFYSRPVFYSAFAIGFSLSCH